MLKIEIPGQEDLTVKNIVLNFNGTLATDGKKFTLNGDFQKSNKSGSS